MAATVLTFHGLGGAYELWQALWGVTMALQELKGLLQKNGLIRAYE
jgi:hypothetical protein